MVLRLDGRSAGTFGRAAAFSFYPTKVMAGGEGGMLLTDDEAIAEEALIYRDQGKASFLTNQHTRLGSNWRMSEPHAAIVLSQLGASTSSSPVARRSPPSMTQQLPDIGLRPLHIPPAASSNYYKYIAFLPDGVDRADLKRTMREEFDIGLSGEVYETGLHQQPVFAAWAGGELPRTEWLCARHVCLPLYPDLADGEVRYVVESLGKTLGQRSRPTPLAGPHPRGDMTSSELIAVTGGSGFVGSHVVDALIDAGHTVRVIDQVAPRQPEAEWVQADILDEDSAHRGVARGRSGVPPRGDGRCQRRGRRTG